MEEKETVKRKFRTRQIKRIIIAGVAATLALLVSTAVYAIEYQNIFTDYAKTFSHYSAPGKHSDTESYKYDKTKSLQGNVDQRHANCNDCHDPHSATRSPSPLGSYFGAGTQANVSGVKVTLWAGRTKDINGNSIWTDTDLNGNVYDDNNFAFVSSVVKEYELCFKCHTRYAFEYTAYRTASNAAGGNHGLTFDWTTRGYLGLGDVPDPTHINVEETDLATEFNPNNMSYHPVIEKGKTLGTTELVWAEDPNNPSVVVNFNQTFTPGVDADSRIKCTDCHASDSTTVKGPHGSNQKYILKRRAPTEEPTITRLSYNVGYRYSMGTRGASTPYNMTWYVRTNDVLCYNCHDTKYYGPGRGHPSRGKHSTNCQWHRPIALDEVGCASCKVTPIHGAPLNRYLMKRTAARDNPNDVNWCYNCHNLNPAQYGRYIGGYANSCPRFYSVDKSGAEQEETRVHFQSAVIKQGSEYFVPLPTPDMPNLKGLGNLPQYRYYNRDDDYILFKYGTPSVTKDNQYKIRFDQPSTGDRPDGEPVAEVGHEDSVSLKTVDHAKDTQVYVSVDGDVVATKSLKTAKTVTDNLGNDITGVINARTSNKDDRSGWFQGVVGYGNTIDEIYAAGNSFIMDFGDLSAAKTIKLVWGVNEEKGAKLPVLIQIKDVKGNWVTRGSARHAEDRYGYIDIKRFFPQGTKDFRVKVIPTLNSVDFMAVSIQDEPVKVTNLSLKKADYRKAGAEATADVTAALLGTDKNYVTFDYLDTADLYFDIPAAAKVLPKRDFIFCPNGYYETGGDIPVGAVLAPMTAEKAQDFGVLTPAGNFANHYNVSLIDPGAWNEKYKANIAPAPSGD